MFRISYLLLIDHVKWILISTIIAIPFSYLPMNFWIQKHNFQSSIDLRVLFISGLIALSASVITISYQVIKASIASPVDSLKYE